MISIFETKISEIFIYCKIKYIHIFNFVYINILLKNTNYLLILFELNDFVDNIYVDIPNNIMCITLFYKLNIKIIF